MFVKISAVYALATYKTTYTILVAHTNMSVTNVYRT